MSLSTPDKHDVLKALATPIRTLILRTLAMQPMTVNQLNELIPFAAQPNVSKNLKILRGAGLVSFTAKGVVHTYSVNKNALSDLVDFVYDIADGAVSASFSVGDIINTRDEADRLPRNSIIVCEFDDDDDSTAVKKNRLSGAWFRCGMDYEVDISGYLPAKLVLLPPVAKH